MKSALPIGLCIATFALTSNPVSATPTQPDKQTISRDVALQQSITIKIAPGRITSIDFDRTDETVIYIGLGDASKTVFSLDAPLKSHRTKSVFLKPIQPLRFPGATVASTTNLLIKTIDRSKTERTYSFNVVPTRTQGTTSIAIAPAIAGKQTLIDQAQHRITLRDIELGLTRAIQRRYTAANDPIVAKTRRLLALAQVQDVPLPDLAKQLQLNLAVLESLGRIGKQAI